MEIKNKSSTFSTKGTDLITWERGARVPACTICYTTHYRVYTEKKSAYTTRISVCHGYSTSTKQHSYVSSISAVLRLPLDIYPFRIVVLSLCVLGFLHVNFVTVRRLALFPLFDVDIPCVHALASFHAGQFRVPCGENSGETHIMNMSLPRKKAPFVRRPPLV